MSASEEGSTSENESEQTFVENESAEIAALREQVKRLKASLASSERANIELQRLAPTASSPTPGNCSAASSATSSAASSAANVLPQRAATSSAATITSNSNIATSYMPLNAAISTPHRNHIHTESFAAHLATAYTTANFLSSNNFATAAAPMMSANNNLRSANVTLPCNTQNVTSHSGASKVAVVDNASCPGTSANYCPPGMYNFSPPVTQANYSQNIYVPNMFLPTRSYGDSLEFPCLTQPPMPNPWQASPTTFVQQIRKLQDLPEFFGAPEQWPTFSVSYKETTAAYRYSNLENLTRLQKALKGAAREQVEALLIHPNSVDAVMNTLEFRFGRPEILIRSQMAKVRAFPAISFAKMSDIVPFSMMVVNLATFLENAGATHHLSNPTLLEELVNKLPMNKREEWAKYTLSIMPRYPNVREFSNWLQQIATYISMAIEMSPLKPITNENNEKKIRNIKTVLTVAPENKIKCVLCQEEHRLHQCNKFKNLSVDERWNFIKSNRLCFCCMRSGHVTQKCTQRRECGISSCRKSHNRLLHNTEFIHRISQPIAAQTSDAAATISNSSNNSRLQAATIGAIANEHMHKKTLFKFLPITLYGPKGHCQVIAFIDEGAKISLVEEQVANAIGVKGASDLLSLGWIGGRKTSEISQRVNIEISCDRSGSSRFEMRNVRTTKKLMLPAQSLQMDEFNKQYEELKDISIPSYFNSSPQLLIGLPHMSLVRPIEVLNFDEGFSAHKTKLGWVLFGSNEENCTEATISHIDYRNQILEDLQKQVQDYFSIENYGITTVKAIVSDADKRAEKILEQTTKKIGNQYETGLLWKKDDITFDNSYTMALKRLESVERKMAQDPELSDWYRSKIKEYVSKTYARKLPPDEASSTDKRTWYLPHFVVRNINKGNKLRLVFDAAASIGNMSLNSMLMKGPEAYQPKPLLSILFNFRRGKIAVCADIREMFHRVRIRHEDQNSQRFLWRDGDASKPPETYVMSAMIFGSASSPCSAQYVKNLNAAQFEDVYPRAVVAITDCHYVDDYVDSFDTVEEAIETATNVVDIHKNAGFELRGFVSNSPKFIETVASATMTSSCFNKISMCHDEVNTEKILGLFWDAKTDKFCFNLNFSRVPKGVLEGVRKPTKREVLSLTMSIFDPFGFLANIIIFSKLLLQKLWRLNVEWNDPIPEEIYLKWYTWYQELKNVNNFQVPRCYNFLFTDLKASVELHIFVDASEVAFAAVAYWRICYETSIDIVFVAGKSRCSPIKSISIPRLELQAAVLGVRLKEAILKSHERSPCEIVFWSDSKTVIQWIRSDSRQYKQFVAHRIAEILEASEINQWRWVAGSQNPADDATRPLINASASANSRWICGPQFLKNSKEDWPKFPKDIIDHEAVKEKRQKCIFSTDVENNFISFHHFSSYYKLLRVLSWVRRAITNFKYIIANKKRSTKTSKLQPLTAAEIKAAEISVCRYVQETILSMEMQLLLLGKSIPKSSQIFSLNPVLDNENIIRLSGRIDNALCVTLNTKRPIILPKSHMLSILIARHHHEAFHHQNQEAVIAAIRSKFWIPNIRKLVKSTKLKCQLCKNLSAVPNQPQMGQLPIDRLTPFVRAFTYTGVDYFGPVQVAVGRRREKRWVALFTCLTVRAIHLELSKDLSSDAAILCLRNFVNRRGTPVRIRSDRGTNFIGASKEEWLIVTQSFQEECTRRGVEWVFNSPANPSAGGVWERMVRCVKRALSFTLKEKAPQVETLLSLLIEAENLVNSRPLTHIPIESTAADPLTPNHFLLGCANYTQTPAIEENICLRKQWLISQQMKRTFWKRWVLEYLPTLTRRTKWHQPSKPLAEKDIVIICEDNECRGEWKRGEIIKIFPAPDGQVRSALVRTSTGILQRPASKLAVLDVCESSSTIPIHGGRDVAA